MLDLVRWHRVRLRNVEEERLASTREETESALRYAEELGRGKMRVQVAWAMVMLLVALAHVDDFETEYLATTVR